MHCTIDTNLLHPDARVRIETVLGLYPVGSTTFMRGCRAGTYPQPVKIAGANTWRLGDILDLCRGEWTVGHKGETEKEPERPSPAADPAKAPRPGRKTARAAIEDIEEARRLRNDLDPF